MTKKVTFEEFTAGMVVTGWPGSSGKRFKLIRKDERGKWRHDGGHGRGETISGFGGGCEWYEVEVEDDRLPEWGEVCL